MIKEIPFYASPGGGACLQATLRMAMEYFEPNRGWTWPMLYEYTAKEEGKGTFPLRMCVNLVNDGYDVVVIDKMDLDALCDNPVKYYKSKYSGEELEYMLANINADIVQAGSKDFRNLLAEGNSLIYENRDFTLKDMEKYLSEGYIIMPCHNSDYIDYKSEYSCHILPLYKMDDKFFYGHDSAWLTTTGKSMARKNMRIPKQHMFDACIMAQGTDAFYAIRKKEAA